MIGTAVPTYARELFFRFRGFAGASSSASDAAGSSARPCSLTMMTELDWLRVSSSELSGSIGLSGLTLFFRFRGAVVASSAASDSTGLSAGAGFLTMLTELDRLSISSREPSGSIGLPRSEAATQSSMAPGLGESEKRQLRPRRRRWVRAAAAPVRERHERGSRANRSYLLVVPEVTYLPTYLRSLSLFRCSTTKDAAEIRLQLRYSL